MWTCRGASIPERVALERPRSMEREIRDGTIVCPVWLNWRAPRDRLWLLQSGLEETRHDP